MRAGSGLGELALDDPPAVSPAGPPRVSKPGPARKPIDGRLDELLDLHEGEWSYAQIAREAKVSSRQVDNAREARKRRNSRPDARQ